MMASLEEPGAIGRIFRINDLVIVHLSEEEHRKYGKKVGNSPKLVPQWSLPMRVIHVPSKGTTATLQCIATGTTTTAHLERVRFVLKPATYGLMKDWERIMRQEIGYFHPQFLEKESDPLNNIADDVGKIERPNDINNVVEPITEPSDDDFDMIPSSFFELPEPDTKTTTTFKPAEQKIRKITRQRRTATPKRHWRTEKKVQDIAPVIPPQ